MKLGAASEIDRHTLQLSEACPAVATSLRVMNSHVDISRLALLLLCTVSASQGGLNCLTHVLPRCLPTPTEEADGGGGTVDRAE